ncbi:RHS repeat-associated core domain-containing protein [uncultured Vagococcus sp.]|uniref:RHS repeat-associated core domain-containing protein n=1 Tax=uncultured Vagococcus sp. TaxID=189676 RepID=UPI0025844597|nr:RHS repeat-associated core domain-containing protein [uncultured Vagococcus sp.]
MRKKVNKGIVSFLVSLLLFTSLPIEPMIVWANELETGTTNQSNVEDLGEKVTKEDLPSEVQDQLDKEEKEEGFKPSIKENSKTLSDVSNDIKDDFERQAGTFVVEDIVEQQEKHGFSEKVDERTEKSKTFINEESGEGETLLFPEAIHYERKGEWKDLKGEMIPDKDEVRSLAPFNPLTVPNTFKEKEIEITLDEKSSVKIAPTTGDYEAVEVIEDSVLLAGNNKAEGLSIKSEQFGTELTQYVNHETKFNELTYEVQVPKESVMTFNESSQLYEVTKDEELQAVLTQPFLEDQEGNPIEALSYELKEEAANKALLTVSAPKEVLEGKSVYKVRSNIVNTTIKKGIESTSIRQYLDTLAYSFQPYMYVGYDDGYNSGTLGAAHFNSYGIVKIPDSEIKKIGNNREVDEAYLSLYRMGTPGYWGDRAKDKNGKIIDRTYEVRGLTKDVGSINSLTYKKFSDLGFPIGQLANKTGKAKTKVGQIKPNSRRYQFDITDLANEWIAGAKNYGLVFKPEKMGKNNLPYSQADIFASPIGGVTDQSPYIVLKHRVRPPIDEKMSLKDTTMKLRPFVSSDNDGLIQFNALGLDGVGRPGAQVNYQIIDDKEKNPIVFEGQDAAIGRDYIFPQYPAIFPNAQEYKVLESNWQTDTLLTDVFKENRLYKTKAIISFGKESATNTYDEFQFYRVTSQDLLPRVLSFYGLTEQKDQFMKDNNMKDDLLTQGNLLFIRNPKKNKGQAYKTTALTTADKMRIDALALGRGKNCTFGFEPINLGSGNYLYDMVDGQWIDAGEEETITRTFNSMADATDGPLGLNWTTNLTMQLNQLEDLSMMLTLADGGKVFFDRQSDATYKVEGDHLYNLTKKVIKDKRVFELTDLSTQFVYTFDATGQIQTIKNSVNQVRTYNYNKEGLLSDITLFDGKKVSFSWNDTEHISSVTYPNQTSTQYKYDAVGHLTEVIDQTGKSIHYEYDKNHRLTKYTDNNGKVLYENAYDDKGRVIKQADGVGNLTELSYGKNTTTTTNANGVSETITYDDRYQTIKHVFGDGKSEEYSYNKDNQRTKVIDRAGKATYYSYDTFGNTTEVSYPNGTKEYFAYNTGNQLIKETNTSNQVTTYEYNPQGLVSKVTHPMNQTEEFYYDSVGQLIKKKTTDDVIEEYQYTQGLVTSVYRGSQLVEGYEYDANGQLLAEIDAAGNKTTYKRNSRGEVVSETNSTGHTSSMTYDAEGNVLTETDFNGHVTKNEYDAIGQVIKQTNPLGAIKTLEYDGVGNVIAETDFNGNQTRYEYDEVDQLIKEISPTGIETTYRYDVLGNQIEKKIGKQVIEKNTYNSQNQLIKSVDAEGDATYYEYDLNDQLLKETDSLGGITHYTYNELSQLIEVTDALGTKTTYEYNKAGRPIVEKQGDRIQKVTYDTFGNVSKETDSLNRTTGYTYDTAGFMKEEIDAAGNKTIYENDGEGNVLKVTNSLGKSVSYTYDGEGNVLTETDGEGHVRKYAYNALGLVIAEEAPTGDILQYVYDGEGNMTESIDPYGKKTRYEYDAENQLRKEIDALNQETTYEYDVYGNMIKKTDPLKRSETYTYNTKQQLIQKTELDGLTYTYTYDALGQLIEMSDESGQSETYTYDLKGRMTQIKDVKGRQTTTAYNEYDEVTQEVDIRGNQTTYTYDKVGQLTKTTYPQQTTSELSYDLLGNVVSETLPNGGVYQYEYDSEGQLVKEIDPHKQVTTYAYNNNGERVSVTRPDGSVEKTVYDENSDVVEEIDAAGNKTTYKYDSYGNVVEVKDAEGRITKEQYDANNRLVSETDALGNKQTYHYDKADRLVKEVNSLGHSIQYEYDSNDRLKTMIDAQKEKTRYTYDKRGNMISMMEPNGGKTTYDYDEEDQLTSETNSKGYQQIYQYDKYSNLKAIKDNVKEKPLVRYEYDQYDRLVKEVDGLDQATVYEYDSVDRFKTTSYPDKTKVSYTYNVLDQLTELTDERGNKTNYTYDALGQMIQVKEADNQVYSYTYDVLGNLKKEEGPLGDNTQYVYNKVGDVIEETDALNQTARYEHDALGQVTKEIDSKKREKTYQYDALGQLIQETDHKGKKTEYQYNAGEQLTRVKTRSGHVTRYAYDTNDNLKEITDPAGNQTRFNYNESDELEKVSLPDGRVESYSYRLDGEMEQSKQSNGVKTTYKYDELNRMVQQKTGSKKQEFVYNEEGQLTKATNETGTHQFDMNEFGDIVKSTDVTGSVLSYEYDSLGRKTATIYPDKTKVTYQYDEQNRMKQVTQPEGQTDYTYDALGRVTNITYLNGNQTMYTYSHDFYVATVKTVNKKAELISEYMYQYDENDNIISDVTTLPKVKQEKTYEYDEDDQLIKVSTKENKQETVITYLYDELGNRIAYKKEVDGASAEYAKYTANEVSQLQLDEGDGATLTYDKNGNVSQKVLLDGTTIDYLYNDANQLIQETTSLGDVTTYQYDALGNRVTSELTHDKKKEGQEDLSHWMSTIDRQQALKAESTDILLSESLALAKENPDAFKKKKEGSASWRNKLTDQLSSRRGSSYVEKVNYVNDLNQSYPRVAQVTQEKQVGKKTTNQASQFIYGEDDQVIGTREESYHEDGLQSIASRVSLSDESLETNELYDSFGSSELPMTNQLGYRGEWHDSQDSQNLRARNYDMSMGRFFQEDSEMGDLDEPGTQNKYAYVGNNPLGYSDESGNKRRGGFRGFVRKVFRPVVRTVRRYIPPRRPYRPAPRRYYPRPAPRRYYPRPVYRAPMRRYVPKRPVYRAPVRRYTPRKIYKPAKKVVRRSSPKKMASYNKLTKAKKASKSKKVQKKPSIFTKVRTKLNKAKKTIKRVVKGIKKVIKQTNKQPSRKTILAKKVNDFRKQVVNKICQVAKPKWQGSSDPNYVTFNGVKYHKNQLTASLGAVPGMGSLSGAGGALLWGNQQNNLPTVNPLPKDDGLSGNKVSKFPDIKLPSLKDIKTGIGTWIIGKGIEIWTSKSYDDLRKKGTEFPEHKVVPGNRLDGKDTPNSSADILNADGTVKRRRYYGKDGRAVEDIDYNHEDDGTHEFPHRHEWDWSKKPPRQDSR